MSGNYVFLDTETTGLDPDLERMFEIAVVTHTGELGVFRIQPPDDIVAAMHPKALEVNRYHERTKEPWWVWQDERVALHMVAEMIDGKHIIGAVPDFDTRFLTAAYKRLGIPVPRWHYHLIDVEARAVGWLAAQGITVELPYESDVLSRLCGVAPPADADRHTAAGDAWWTKRLYERTGTKA